MNVTFSTIDDYLAELKLAPKEQVVRVTIVENEVNNGTTEVAVISGFFDERSYYEARLDCGEDLRGGKGEGSEKASSLTQRIESACRELGITCRGGRWQWPRV